jgi:hypothetical protein
MKKLFILGDSFSFGYKTENLLWPIITSNQLESVTGSKVEVINHSLIGSSQDFIWKNLSKVLEEITPEDFLVVILTSENRFWFFEDRPEHSNIMSVDNIKQMTSDIGVQNAVTGFLRHIWRDSIAELHQNHRLGYLSYHSLKKNLRKPIILKGFPSSIIKEENFPDLIFSKGNLLKVQLEEFVYPNKNLKYDNLLDNKYWHHIDCRYNHLCLSNHKILGEILSQSLINETSPDLESNLFYKSLITENNLIDKEFAAKELSMSLFNEMLNNRLRKKLGANPFKLKF